MLMPERKSNMNTSKIQEVCLTLFNVKHKKTVRLNGLKARHCCDC